MKRVSADNRKWDYETDGREIWHVEERGWDNRQRRGITERGLKGYMGGMMPAEERGWELVVGGEKDGSDGAGN